MDDLIGLGKGSEKLIEVISSAVGAIYKPYGIRREARAEEYKLKLLESAKLDADVKRIKLLSEAKAEEMVLLDDVKTTVEQRAIARQRFNEARKQINLESVLSGAFNYVGDSVSEEAVDPDWLQELIRYAEEANSAHMQELWSKVLAGETEQPGSYSLRSMEVLKNISRKEAELFSDFCQFSSNFKDGDYRFIVSGFYKPYSIKPATEAKIDLNKYRIDFRTLTVLDNVGLLHRDDISYPRKELDPFVLVVSGKTIEMTPKKEDSRLLGYNFTQAGSELFKLTNKEPNEEYIAEFLECAKELFETKIVDEEHGIS